MIKPREKPVIPAIKVSKIITTGTAREITPKISLGTKYCTKFDNPASIDSTTGQINTDPDYENVYGIIYECPTPKSVQYPDPLSRQLDATERKYTGKWHVLILSPKGLGHFLNLIDTGTT